MHTIFDAMTAVTFPLKLKSCSECTGDLCNATNHLHPGAWIALLVSVVTFACLQQ